MQHGSEHHTRHADPRQAILEATLDMLEGTDITQITMGSVAREAGINHAAPYKHFPDKSALLAELSLLGFDRLTQAIQGAHTATFGGLSEELTSMCRSYLAFAEYHPSLYRLMFSNEAPHGPRTHQDPRSRAPLHVVVDLLERGQAAGHIRPGDPRGLATACWAHLHGLTLLALEDLLGERKVGPEIERSTIEFLVDALAA